MSFSASTDITCVRENYNYIPLSTEDDWDAETSPLIPKADSEIKTTTGQKIVTWIKDHKSEIYDTTQTIILIGMIIMFSSFAFVIAGSLLAFEITFYSGFALQILSLGASDIAERLAPKEENR